MLEIATFLFYSISLEKKLTVINLKLFCQVVTNQSATGKTNKIHQGARAVTVW